LDEICTKARAEKLKVVHQQKVEECMRNPPPRVDDPRAACERMWNGYGWGVPTGKGGRSPTLYNEIPECLAAFEARKEDIR
ncbi:MAG TPA: hypothetical protein VJM53_08070, partial [Burkholderiales bacterium]|nr:hypothetical protein [Burkholderiales bacterium]